MSEYVPCEHCAGEPEVGYIEMPNNGPIVKCPVCNGTGKRPTGRSATKEERDE